MRKLFEGYSFSDAEIRTAIENLHKSTGELLDPHSIIGVLAGQRGHADPENIMIALATAHPAKFTEAIEKALPSYTSELPNKVAKAFEQEEIFTILPDDYLEIKQFILSKAL